MHVSMQHVKVQAISTRKKTATFDDVLRLKTKQNKTTKYTSILKRFRAKFRQKKLRICFQFPKTEENGKIN